MSRFHHNIEEIFCIETNHKFAYYARKADGSAEVVLNSTRYHTEGTIYIRDVKSGPKKGSLKRKLTFGAKINTHFMTNFTTAEDVANDQPQHFTVRHCANVEGNEDHSIL